MENLKKYRTEPDPKVWRNISRRLIVRNVAVVAAVAALLGGAVAVAFALKPNSPKVEEPTTEVAQLLAEPITAQPEVAIVVEQRTEKEPQKAVKQDVEEAVLPVQPAVTQPKLQPQQTTQEATIVLPQVAASEPDVDTTVAPVADVPASEPTTKPSPATKGPSLKAPTTPPADLVLVPNAFTPSVPGPNDHFIVGTTIDTVGALYDFRILVYNRRGAKVYESDDINFRWDGTSAGRPIPQGAYAYIIRYRDSRGEQHLQKGTVTLIR
ncbi:MAG: gliding motility-associated C-terminal domain-containing protein [Bacteroidales bacterium]|nr:gliding motility-associated C-terminal domain-containing protein [Bacteroidales bacterium]